MRRLPILATFALLLVVAATLAAACTINAAPAGKGPSRPAGSTGPAPTNGLTQSNSAASVDINVTWGGVNNGSLVLSVVLDTHSVDLDQYDLGKLALLRDDAGKEYRPSGWNAALGGHHRQGTLTLPAPDSLNAGTARYVELLVRDVAGVKERVFKWDLGPKA